MGTFTELNMWFYFREDTPTEVVSTFQPVFRPTPVMEAHYGPPALVPFEPDPDDEEWWEPDWKDLGVAEVDPFASEPWRHAWASALSGSASVSTLPGATLVWDSQLELWHFSCRAAFKTGPDTILDFLGWLAPYIRTPDADQYPHPILVGIMTYGAAVWPFPLYCQNGRLLLQDLNRPASDMLST